jgi:hypothetical protein
LIRQYLDFEGLASVGIELSEDSAVESQHAETPVSPTEQGQASVDD